MLIDEFREVPVVLKDMPVEIRGFCCLGSDFSPIIVINSRLSKEQQRKTYKHELEHIWSGQMDDPNYHEYGDVV